MIRVAVLSGLGHAVFVAAGLLVYVMGTRIGHQRRHPSAAVAWVLGIVAFPYLIVPLFLLFGTRKFARPARRTRGQALLVPDGAPAWAARLLASMELAPAMRNRQVVLHADGGEALPVGVGPPAAHRRNPVVVHGLLDERLECSVHEVALVECGDLEHVFGLLHGLDAQQVADEVAVGARRPGLEAGGRGTPVHGRRDGETGQVAVEAGEVVAAALVRHVDPGGQHGVDRAGGRVEIASGRGGGEELAEAVHSGPADVVDPLRG